MNLEVGGKLGNELVGVGVTTAKLDMLAEKSLEKYRENAKSPSENIKNYGKVP